MEKEKRLIDSQLLIKAVIILVISLGIARWLYSDQQTKLASLKSEIETELKRNELLNELSRVYGEAEGYWNRLPEKEEENLLRNKIIEAARSNNVELSALQLDESTKEGRYIIQPIKTSCSGGYSALNKFITGLENLGHFVQFISFHCKVAQPLTDIMLYQPASEENDKNLTVELGMLIIYVKKSGI